MKLEHLLLAAGAIYLFTQKKGAAAPAQPQPMPEIMPPIGTQLATSEAMAAQSQAISDLSSALTAIQTAAPTSDSSLPGAQLVPQEAAPLTAAPIVPTVQAAPQIVTLEPVKPATITFTRPGGSPPLTTAPITNPPQNISGGSQVAPLRKAQLRQRGQYEIPERDMWRRQRLSRR